MGSEAWGRAKGGKAGIRRSWEAWARQERESENGERVVLESTARLRAVAPIGNHLYRRPGRRSLGDGGLAAGLAIAMARQPNFVCRCSNSFIQLNSALFAVKSSSFLCFFVPLCGQNPRPHFAPLR